MLQHLTLAGSLLTPSLTPWYVVRPCPSSRLSWLNLRQLQSGSLLHGPRLERRRHSHILYPDKPWMPRAPAVLPSLFTCTAEKPASHSHLPFRIYGNEATPAQPRVSPTLQEMHLKPCKARGEEQAYVPSSKEAGGALTS